MLRSLFLTASIFALLVPTFIFPGPTAAAGRCPVEPPKTLLYLYRNSDSIHIGRYDRLEEGKITEDTEDYTAIDIKKHFSISSTLKGEPRKLFNLEDKEYRYKNQETAEGGGEIEEGDFADEDQSLEPGDSVILFLKNGETKDDPPTLTHWRNSLKKMTRDELESYEKRLRELNSIFGGKNVSDAAIVRWLVDAVIDPNTRWEGAFELLQSFQDAEWKKEREEEQAQLRKNGEPVRDEAEESEHIEAEPEPDTSVFSQLLTAGQKNELMNALLNSKPADKEAKPSDRQQRGDDVLIQLVTRWGDSRLAAFLVERLRNAGEDNYQRSDLMVKIADVLKDSELSAISEKYSEATYQEDDAIVGASDEGAEEPAVKLDAGDTGSQAGSAEGTPKNGEATDGGEMAPKVTYRQLRAELMAKFLSRTDTVLAKANEANNAKLVNNSH